MAWFGSSIAFIGTGVVVFFLYDASTYKESPEHLGIDVSHIALNPRRGGPKNLPIYEVQIDDDDCMEKRQTKDKPKLVILGGGWGSVAMLKGLNPPATTTSLSCPRPTTSSLRPCCRRRR